MSGVRTHAFTLIKGQPIITKYTSIRIMIGAASTSINMTQIASTISISSIGFQTLTLPIRHKSIFICTKMASIKGTSHTWSTTHDLTSLTNILWIGFFKGESTDTFTINQLSPVSILTYNTNILNRTSRTPNNITTTHWWEHTMTTTQTILTVV